MTMMLPFKPKNHDPFLKSPTSKPQPFGSPKERAGVQDDGKHRKPLSLSKAKESRGQGSAYAKTSKFFSFFKKTSKNLLFQSERTSKHPKNPGQLAFSAPAHETCHCTKWSLSRAPVVLRPVLGAALDSFLSSFYSGFHRFICQEKNRF